jgi:hypothetical protein
MKSAPQYSKLLPGQTPVQFAPQLYRDPSASSGVGRPGRDSALNRPVLTAEQAMAGGPMYAGNPDTSTGRSWISTTKSAASAI